MATTGDGSGGAADFRSPFRLGSNTFDLEINEEPQNVSQEVSELRIARISATPGMLELGQVLKQMTFTRSETQYLIALLHSRTIEESPSSLVRVEASTSGSLKKQKHGDARGNFQPAVVVSRVLEEEILPHSGLTKASPATMENLPGELLSNIFFRLLAKQVAQMRSVCKSWNSLLSQPSFVKSHFDRSIHTNDQILLVFYDGLSLDPKQFTSHPCESPHLELTNFIKLPVNPLPDETSSHISIIGSLNGLICSFYGYNNPVIHIWNPSLSAVLTLPSYAMPSPCENNTIEIYFRFGFDPGTNDYKVVKLTSITGPHNNDVKWWLQVEMYSMRKGCWELITESFPLHITTIYNDDVVCGDGHDGHLHWLGENLDSQTIVSFDLGSETFREILLPGNTDEHLISLGVLGEKLCVMSRVEDGSPIEVWVMDVYGVAESWVKRHVFSKFNEPDPYGFTSNKKFLFVDDGNCRFVLYDPVADKAKIFENHCSDGWGVERIVEYVDSLVWVTPARQN